MGEIYGLMGISLGLVSITLAILTLVYTVSAGLSCIEERLKKLEVQIGRPGQSGR